MAQNYAPYAVEHLFYTNPQMKVGMCGTWGCEAPFEYNVARGDDKMRAKEGSLLDKVQNSANHWQCRRIVGNAIQKSYPDIAHAMKHRRSTKGKAELKAAINCVLDGIRDELTDFE